MILSVALNNVPIAEYSVVELRAAVVAGASGHVSILDNVGWIMNSTTTRAGYRLFGAVFADVRVDSFTFALLYAAIPTIHSTSMPSSVVLAVLYCSRWRVVMSRIDGGGRPW